ncbi:MAG: hypothetical protein KAS17_03505 [Victivallaceae bacterium]|nr:hypothetical protein [Victivallaceae bacterium]
MNQQAIAVFGEDEDEFCSSAEHLRCICHQDNQELLLIPAVKNSYIHINNYLESAFNTHDFFDGTDEYMTSKEEYARQEELKRADKLAMLASCITDEECFQAEKKRFWNIAEKLDQIRSAYKNKLEVTKDSNQKQSLARKIVDIDSQLEELQSIWNYWMQYSTFS